MRVSELSELAGVSIPSIKFYIREGLLSPGEATGPRQAEYSSEHVRRLRLIRTLTEVGRLTLREVREVVDAIEDARPLHELLGVAHRALGPRRSDDPAHDQLEAAQRDVDGLLSSLGWRVTSDAPARAALARALNTLRRTGRDADVRVFAPYARVAERLAAREIRAISRAATRTETVDDAVVGTVVFELALVALRRLAHEHHSARRFGSAR